MAKIIKFPVQAPEKFGNRKIRKKRKPDLEEFGQLNLFDQGKVVNLPGDRSFFEEALKLDETGNPDAEKFYLLAIDQGECIEDSFCNLAVLKSSQGDHISAVNYLTQCLQKSPRHFEAHYNLGNVYSDIGNFELAKAHYEVATQIAPDYPNAHYNLGLVLISLKEYKRAIGCINKYVDLSPDADTDTARELISTLNAIAQ
ncbi:MAG: tetratricopeptide repeat protein [Cyclobacteriaceae bacterium]